METILSIFILTQNALEGKFYFWTKPVPLETKFSQFS